MKEIWKKVNEEDFKDYWVSNLGRVKNRKGQILIPYLRKDGYLTVRLCNNGKKLKKDKRIHRLVMESFNDTDNRSLDVNHIDGDKTNNKLDNLEWCTRTENLKHAVRIGLNKQAIRIKAIKGNKEVFAYSLRSLYSEMIKVEKIKGIEHTFTENVRRAIRTNGTYYGYTFVQERK